MITCQFCITPIPTYRFFRHLEQDHPRLGWNHWPEGIDALLDLLNRVTAVQLGILTVQEADLAA